MKYFFKTKQKAFTIVETLVAIAILMIAIAGPLTIAQKGLTAAIYARDQITASFLAQDAMEYIKNVRDNNILVEIPWLTGLTDNTKCNSLPNQCSVDTYSNSANFCLDSSCILYHDNVNGYRIQGNASNKSQFSRSFYIVNPVNSSDEAKAIVTVSWQNGTISNAVTLENELFNITR